MKIEYRWRDVFASSDKWASYAGNLAWWMSRLAEPQRLYLRNFEITTTYLILRYGREGIEDRLLEWKITL